jgi:hypothetical protein
MAGTPTAWKSREKSRLGFTVVLSIRKTRLIPVAQESFVYPIYVVFLIAPTIHLPFGTAAEIFRWLLLSAIAFSVPLWMYVAGLRLHRVVLFSSILLAVSSYPAVEEYFQQNLAALVLLFLAAAAAAAVRNWLVLSGFLLALATAKPDTTGIGSLVVSAVGCGEIEGARPAGIEFFWQHGGAGSRRRGDCAPLDRALSGGGLELSKLWN